LSATDPVPTSVGYRDGVAVLSVGGEIDLATAPALEAAIDEVLGEDPPMLVIDLSGVEFLASAGLRILVATRQKLGESAPFAVVASGPATSRPIQLTGLEEVFPLYPTLDAALGAVRANADEI
jgi:anti-sigma B factor antagonist